LYLLIQLLYIILPQCSYNTAYARACAQGKMFVLRGKYFSCA